MGRDKYELLTIGDVLIILDWNFAWQFILVCIQIWFSYQRLLLGQTNFQCRYNYHGHHNNNIIRFEDPFHGMLHLRLCILYTLYGLFMRIFSYIPSMCIFLYIYLYSIYRYLFPLHVYVFPICHLSPSVTFLYFSLFVINGY